MNPDRLHVTLKDEMDQSSRVSIAVLTNYSNSTPPGDYAKYVYELTDFDVFTIKAMTKPTLEFVGLVHLGSTLFKCNIHSN
jgi:hypothetical protein